MNYFQAGFTPAQVAKRKFLLLGFSSCALALSCVSFSAAVSVDFNYLIVRSSAWLCLCDFALLCEGLPAAVGVNFNYLIVCLGLSLCLRFSVYVCVCDFDLLS